MWLSQNVKNYTEILGVIMNNEVKWNNHIDFSVKKASKVQVKVHLSTVRPVSELEYVVPVQKAVWTIYSI